MNFDLIVIGGGAAGFFAALSAKKANPFAKILILEKTAQLLSKVRVSGGGRCNVTHNCFDPKEFIKNYPRGSKELLGPFTRFSPKDTIEWFESRGVKLKAEEDGRIFPITDSSQTIIDCLINEAQKLGVEIQTQTRIETINKEHDHFLLQGEKGEMRASKLVLATGSSPQGHAWAKGLGHTIEPLIPSLFTFHSPTSPLLELSGVSVEDAEVRLEGRTVRQRGPLLITHFGFSGPAIIKLSAWEAPYLFENNYKAKLIINWLPHLTPVQVARGLREKSNRFNLPKSLWNSLSHKTLQADIYEIDGKTMFKKEFVTCGGVRRSEVNFKTMESKVCPGLYFTGEILDIDGVTGGFNFQNAWTTAYIAGNSLDFLMETHENEEKLTLRTHQ